MKVTSNNEAIRLEHITKQYRTGTRQLRYLSELVHETMLHAIGREGHYKGRINALDDVSISVQKGERVALIGKNGSGKSTCLKVIAGVTKPTDGARSVTGSIGALIEVTVGFRQELTGKDNIYLNASLQGLRRKQITERYPDIVAFSGLRELHGADWLGTPVKWYSSGMYVRLGFSIAAFLDPDILIVDEALAVGDAEFQQKCIAHMRKLADSGKTIVFVTHGLESAKMLCNRGIVLDNGKVMLDSDIDTAVSYYKELRHTCAS